MIGWMIAATVVIMIIQIALLCMEYPEGAVGVWAISFILGLAMTIFCESVLLFAIGAILLLSALATIVSVIGALTISETSRREFIVFDVSFVILYLILCITCNIYVVAPQIDNKIYEAEVVRIESPEVHEKRYEILSEEDLSNAKDLEFSSIIKICDESGKSGDYYIIYYKLEESDEIVTVPLCIVESELEIIPITYGVEAYDSEYLLEITETYYKEDRNQNPPVVEYDSTVVRYELYLKESTISKIPEITR